MPSGTRYEYLKTAECNMITETIWLEEKCSYREEIWEKMACSNPV